MLIGRKEEIEHLKRLSQDKKSHFIAIYGRRRVGKTFLIRECFDYRFTFHHTGLSSGSMKKQLAEFVNSVVEAGGEFKSEPKNWQEAFHGLQQLVKQSGEKRKVIFLDELSWMDTPRSDFMVALEAFWNGFASARKDIVLIVCSSATSWMISNIIHNKGGLYNRLTDSINLQTFTLKECEEYVHSMDLKYNREQILQYYMIFGGVPYYWSFLEKGLSLPQNIDKILFSENAPLANEFDYLYSSIFRKPETYIKIIEALGTKKAGMTRNEIIEASQIINSGDLSMKLKELESCGFIRTYQSFGKKSKETVYQLIDCFTLFYFKFLKDKPKDAMFWSNQINMPSVNAWMGLAFERICFLHINQIKRKLGISGVLTDVNSFYCKPNSDTGIFGSQIDMLIVRKDQIINVCEIKYSASEYTVNKDFSDSMRKKINDIQTITRTKYAIFPTLITTYGMVYNSYSGEIQSLVTMDDLFE